MTFSVPEQLITCTVPCLLIDARPCRAILLPNTEQISLRRTSALRGCPLMFYAQYRAATQNGSWNQPSGSVSEPCSQAHNAPTNTVNG
jgi:hypothetical protein